MIAASRCTKCESTWYPRRDRCPACLSDQLSVADLPSRGTVYSFTTVFAPQHGFEGPYRIAYVDLEGDVRVLARVIGEGSLRCGMRGEVVGRPVRDAGGAEREAPHFIPEAKS